MVQLRPRSGIATALLLVGVTLTFGESRVALAVDGCGLSEYEDEVYLVTSKEDLEWITSEDHPECLDDAFRLTTDVDLSAITNWDPIGDSSMGFSGTFDGDGHKVSGLNVACLRDGSEVSTFQGLEVGFFGLLDGGTVTDLVIDDASVVACVPATAGGVLAGRSIGNSVISEVDVSGSIVFDLRLEDVEEWVEVEPSENRSEYLFNLSVGGLIGYSENTEISSATSSVSVSAPIEDGFDPADDPASSFEIDNKVAAKAGGLIGDAYATTIVESSTTGDVAGDEVVGGLVGYSGSTVIGDSSASGDVEGTFMVGGAIGWMADSRVSDTRATGSVDGNDETGGLIGHAWGISSGSSIDRSSSHGEVNGGDYTGGLIGYADGVTISRSFSTSNVRVLDDDDYRYAGGLVGWADASITKSYATGSVVGNRAAAGLAGFARSPATFVTISDSYATGDVESVINDDPAEYNGSENGAAGLVAVLDQNSTIVRSFALGDVRGPNWVAGLVSHVGWYAEIEDSYARGTVDGERAAGLVGELSHDANVRRSYAAGGVSGSSGSAGLILAAPGVVSNQVSASFWDVDVSPVESEDGGIGKTSGEMRDPSTFSSEGWNLRSVWCVLSDKNGGYPGLRSIDFGPENSTNCGTQARGSSRRSSSVSLDPNGGVCTYGGTERVGVWTVTFRGSFVLPNASECLRPGYALVGWSRSGPTDDPNAVLHSTISRSTSLIASWGQLPPPPTFVAVIRESACSECRTVLVAWPIAKSPDVLEAIVRIDRQVVTCDGRFVAFGFDVCRVPLIAPLSLSTASVSFTNRFGEGLSTPQVFSIA